jgi:O-antigen/teichoic acid export membrane protein
MLDYLRRLATTGFAYTGASVISKLVAVALLPVYTALVSPSEYGQAEVLFAAVVAFSIVVRFGLLEALLRFYYLPEERGVDVVRTGFAALFWAVTAFSILLLPFAEMIADALDSEPGLVRIAIGGLWLLTLYEYLLTLLRIDERAKAYFLFTFVHVLVAIPLTLVLIVGADLGAEALLLGSYASGIPFVLYLVVSERRRIGLSAERPLLGRMLRFGFPTMPAELSLYSLNFADRVIIVAVLGATGNATVGLYAIAFKFSQSVQILVRGFQLAWPPLAYSIVDDDEARRVYAVVVSAFTGLCALVVVAVWLEARWIVDLLAASEYSGAYSAVGLLVLGSALNGVYLALLVVLGRTGRTEFNFPATLAALVVNIGLNLWLVPDHGIVGAGIALVGAYSVAVVLMYVFTQRLFHVPYEWGRLAAIVLVSAGLIAFGDLVLPTEGFVGFITRAAVIALYLPILWFAAMNGSERAQIAELAHPSVLRARLAELRARGEAAERERTAEGDFIRSENLDEDIRNF